jgi:lipopolysaccharide/colanic/teichoic acid biosynthesis glycosyltransferase
LNDNLGGKDVISNSAALWRSLIEHVCAKRKALMTASKASRVFDLGLLLLAAPLAVLVRGLFPGDAVDVSVFGPFWAGSLLGVLGWLIWRPDKIVWRYGRKQDWALLLVLACVGPLMGTLIGFSVNRLAGIPRALPLLQAVLAFGGLAGFRLVVRGWDKAATARPPAHADRHVVVGDISHVGPVVTFLQDHRHAGVLSASALAGVLTVQQGLVSHQIGGTAILGSVADLEACLLVLDNHGLRVSRLILASPEALFDAEDLACIAQIAAKRGITLVPMGHVFDTPEAAPDSTDPHWSLRPKLGLAFKRGLDVTLSALMLISLFPALLCIVIALKLTSWGEPAVFWQYRPGLGGRVFRLYKLRTLGSLVDPISGAPRQLEHRHTGFARFIRQLRLDELPQLWNILIGDMSFVGPRPLLQQDQPNDARRLVVRPGLTGWAQINGGTTLSPDDKNALDLFYIRRIGLWFDFQILLLTLWRLRSGERIDAHVLKAARMELALPLDARLTTGRV